VFHFLGAKELDKKLEMNRLFAQSFGKMKHLFFYRPIGTDSSTEERSVS
jgi:hypothetical protein